MIPLAIQCLATDKRPVSLDWSHSSLCAGWLAVDRQHLIFSGL
jgi:hypothetical protein